MDADILVKESEGMSKEAIKEVVHYMRYIKANEADTVTRRGNSQKKGKRSRYFGIYKGQIWMSDDFDEPLEDFREYM